MSSAMAASGREDYPLAGPLDKGDDHVDAE